MSGDQRAVYTAAVADFKAGNFGTGQDQVRAVAGGGVSPGDVPAFAGRLPPRDRAQDARRRARRRADGCTVLPMSPSQATRR
jgi:hypothetical protein